jgi:hypothetical protein
MRQLFRQTLSIALFAAAVFSPGGADAALTVVRIPDDADMAAHVYVGADGNMPVGSNGFYISINPTRTRNGDIAVPGTVAESLSELERSLPHWYLNALVRARGSSECSVIISEDEHSFLDVSTYVEEWAWINWRLGESASTLRRDFFRMGLTSQTGILAALRAGFCTYVKTGDGKLSLRLIAQYGRK